MKINKKVLLCAIIAVAVFAVMLVFDLLSKHFIVKALPNVGDSMDFLPGFINFVYIQNTGAAWGIFSGRSAFLIIMSLIVLGLYLWFFAYRLKKSGSHSSVTLAVSVGLISGGCIGNLVDRLVFGYVRDFLNFQFMDFPVFNVADVSLTIGIIVMVAYFIFLLPREDKKNAVRADFMNDKLFESKMSNDDKKVDNKNICDFHKEKSIESNIDEKKFNQAVHNSENYDNIDENLEKNPQNFDKHNEISQNSTNDTKNHTNEDNNGGGE